MALALLIGMLAALARQNSSPPAILIGVVLAVLTASAFSEKLPGARELASSMGNEGLLTVGALFVVAAGLTHTGALQGIGGLLLGKPGRVGVAQVRLALPVTGFSAFLNNTPVVAMLIPVVQEWCRRGGISPSKMLLPLSYISILGGCCTLIGTSTNLVVQGQLIQQASVDPSVQPMGMFTLTPVGLAVTIAGVGLIVLGGRWLLPDRGRGTDARESFRQYTVEMNVEPGGLIDGKSVADAGLRGLSSLYLVEVRRREGTIAAVGPEEVLRGGDRLIFAGAVESVAELQTLRGLTPSAREGEAPHGDHILAEAVVSHTSSLIGRTIREASFRGEYDAAVIAVRRHGGKVRGRIGDISLRPGDSLLVETNKHGLRRLRGGDEFYVVADVGEVATPNEGKIHSALVILALLVVAMVGVSLPWPEPVRSFTERVSILYLAMAAAGAMVVTGCLNQRQARESINWGVLIVIGAALYVAEALESSGLAEAVVTGPMSWFEPLGPWGLLAGVYLLTLILTELVTNNAAAALAFPFAVAAAASAGAPLMPFALAVAVAASCGFATPVAYQTHLMVMQPGRYTFGDFLRIGVPMDLLCAAVALTVLPMIYPLG